DCAHRDADQHHEEGRDQRHLERDPPAVEQAEELVSAERAISAQDEEGGLESGARARSRPTEPSAPRTSRSVLPVSKFWTCDHGPTGSSPSSSASGKMVFGPCPTSFCAIHAPG